ncbi:putative zinc-binding protein [Luteimonas composti]|uniref:Zinc-binding protein n=1 Tax=Luteimonas composti TaxID=398257 RepID=A0ABT6MT77_9GAMM|nr:putative zinc-binding protein [Luteimonas composti]MDH7453822.1 putative zinc-binding protein [Luteimonas composti]
MTGRVKPPLVYSCSGCSSAAQMANQLALWLDRAGAAEMSCIAGVGGGVAGLVRTAQSGRPILALDGCVLHCVSACLAQAGVQADAHLTLSDYGVAKRRHADFDQAQARAVFEAQVLPAARALHPAAGGDTLATAGA